jgi:hypothetical protein
MKFKSYAKKFASIAFVAFIGIATLSSLSTACQAEHTVELADGINYVVGDTPDTFSLNVEYPSDNHPTRCAVFALFPTSVDGRLLPSGLPLIDFYTGDDYCNILHNDHAYFAIGQFGRGMELATELEKLDATGEDLCWTWFMGYVDPYSVAQFEVVTLLNGGHTVSSVDFYTLLPSMAVGATHPIQWSFD